MTAPFLTLHALHALPPSLVNRDNNNAAKTISFGGSRRLRVSSQSWKRAIVLHMRDHRIADAQYAVRSARVPGLVADALVSEHGRDRDVALWKVAAVFSAFGLKAKPNGQTAVSLYINEELPAAVAASINAHWDQIVEELEGDGDTAVGEDDADDGKKKAKAVVPDETLAAVRVALDVDKAVDLALTGRMLAEIPGTNIDGAVHVAHAFSVQPAAIESDFFTAVDDAAPADEPVSTNLGETDLAAPLLYRSASLDRRQLRRNLAGAADPEALAEAAEAAFIRAFIASVPGAKSTSTNSATLPSVVVSVDSDSVVSLANAFVTPVAAGDVLAEATRRMVAVAERGQRVWPGDSLTALVLDPALDGKVGPAVEVDSLDEFITAVR